MNWQSIKITSWYYKASKVAQTFGVARFSPFRYNVFLTPGVCRTIWHWLLRASALYFSVLISHQFIQVLVIFLQIIYTTWVQFQNKFYFATSKMHEIKISVANIYLHSLMDTPLAAICIFIHLCNSTKNIVTDVNITAQYYIKSCYNTAYCL